MLFKTMLTQFLINQFVSKNINPKDIKIRKKLGMLSGTIGIICNLLLSASKFFAGIITSSIAISADGFNNLSDAVSSIVTLICFKTSGNPADKKHPFGYGRIEYISGLIVSIAIIFMGIELIKSSVEGIFSLQSMNTNMTAIIILIISLIIKLWLGFLNKKIGTIMDSTAVKATAFDSIADAAITITILFGTVINYLTNISIDAYLGIAVAVFIVYTGIKMIKETLSPLIGQSPDPEFIKKIRETVSKYPKILGVHEIIVHSYGPGKNFVSFHAETDASRNINDVHEEINSIEKLIEEKFDCQAIIHVDPIITDNKIINEIREKLIHDATELIDENAKIYDLRIIPEIKCPRLLFSISIPYDVKKTDTEISKIISESLISKYNCTIDIKRYYFD